MIPNDILPILIIALILFLVIFYLLIQKRKGSKCIGCPYGSSCTSKHSLCACSSKTKEKGKNYLQTSDDSEPKNDSSPSE